MSRARRLVLLPLVATVVAIAVGILVGILVLRASVSADQVLDDRDSWADLGRAVMSIVLGVVVGVLVWVAGLVRSSLRLFRRGERLGVVILSVTAAFALIVLVNTIAGALGDGAGLPGWLSQVLMWLGVAVVVLAPSAVFRLWDTRAGAAEPVDQPPSFEPPPFEPPPFEPPSAQPPGPASSAAAAGPQDPGG